MASLGVFQHKSGSREMGQVWQQIATNLNAFRAVRERFTAIMRKYKVKMRK